ncbi:MAG: putative mechanosensitive channel protein [Labilithrix sp.]|nr:putative mechanosensitive channel protein [Labilithrix sp.]
MTSFLVAVEDHDYATAAQLLDLHALSPSVRAARGAELAQQLEYVLVRNVWIEPDMLSDAPEGNPADGADVERIGIVRSGGADVPILLSRLAGGKGWAISASTVARVPRLYEDYGPGWIETHIPKSFQARLWGLAAWQWLGVLVALVLAFAIGRAVTFVGSQIGGRLAARTEVEWDDELVVALRRPSRFLFGVVAFNELLGLLSLTAVAMHVFSRLLGIITIGALGWAVLGVVGVVANVVERRAMIADDADARTHLRARGIRTKVRVLRRVADVAVGVLTIALMLTQFEVVRNIGVSLLASAGVAGIVLGFAAQRTIGSLIAGIQLSFTQPIRIGDVVIVEKEWGTIEEVTLTYVVVRVWDERRLIVPMSRFLEHPFENWTKVSPDLHGTVFLQVDWRLPVDAVRAELDRIVVGNPRWDGRTKSVCVTNTTDRTIEVRALVSAANAGTLWDLRVEVREKLVTWLQAYEGGQYLPRLRLEEGEQPSRSTAVS